MKVTCYSKYNPIFTCDLENGMIVKIFEVLDKDHLPILLQDNMTVSAANEWLKTRKLSENRDGLKEARLRFPEFECYHNMFSLSDQYWFQYGKKESWDKLNFFTNPFSEDIGRIFFEPWTVEDTKENPDLTTNGVLKKQWIQKEGKQYLVKAGNRRFHQEPISEVLSSMTLEAVNIIPFVKYSLIVHGLQMCCICENFIDENTEYVPASHIYYKEKKGEGESVYSHLLKMCEVYNIKGAKKFVDNMVAADHFICNTDRHLGNFGFIRDVESGNITGFAPLFDFGSSFFSAQKTSELFSEMETECIAKALGRIAKSGAILSPDALLKLADVYPLITESECNYIKKNIIRVYNEFEKAKKKREAKLKEEELLFS